MRHALILTVLLAAAPAAAQPYSKGLSQCGALYGLVAMWSERPEHVEPLERAAGIFANAAFDQALAEGLDNPAETLDRQADDQRALWAAEGRLWVFSEEFRDWAAYCRKFAKSRGLDLGLDAS